MIVIMKKSAEKEQVMEIIRKIEAVDIQVHPIYGVERTVLGLVGEKSRVLNMSLESMDGVEKVVSVLSPYKLASREYREERTVVTVRGVEIGGEQIQVMAGPCAVESREQIIETAKAVKAAGATVLRGGAFKPRTSPYSFQGLEAEGLKYMAEAREITGLLVISEVVNPGQVDLVAEYVDIIQIGARNMQNFSLLRKVAKAGRPVMLKRGLSATIEEWVMAAEYILSGGNPDVILCERGIRTYETMTRNTLDLSAVPLIKNLTHLPVIADPSHGTGRKELIEPMSMAALAAGADGLMIEVHPAPEEALSDGPQSLRPGEFRQLMEKCSRIAGAAGRKMQV